MHKLVRLGDLNYLERDVVGARRALVDVQVDAEQDQRPKNGRKQSGADLLDRIQMGPVVVSHGNDYAGDDVNERNQADSWPCPCSCRRVVSHVAITPFPRRLLCPACAALNGAVAAIATAVELNNWVRLHLAALKCDA